MLLVCWDNSVVEIGDDCTFAEGGEIYAYKDTKTEIKKEQSEWSINYPEEKEYREIKTATGYKYYYEDEDKTKIYYNGGNYTVKIEDKTLEKLYNKKEKEEQIQYKLPFGGGSGAGVSINPVAFIVIQENNVRLLPIEHCSSIDRLLDYIPDFMDKIGNSLNKSPKQTYTNQ